MQGAYDIQSILKYLPHRYPFILVDRIVSLEPSVRAVGLKNVTINEPFFQGHFPDAPVMPGVLIVEAMAQVGGVLYFVSREETSPRLMYFMGFNNVKFRKPVIPGDQLMLKTEILKQRAAVVKLAATAEVDGVRVAEAELMASAGDKQ